MEEATGAGLPAPTAGGAGAEEGVDGAGVCAGIRPETANMPPKTKLGIVKRFTQLFYLYELRAPANV